MLSGRVVVRVLDDALAHLEGQVEAAEFRIAQFEILDDAQGLQVVVEEVAMALHGNIESPFSRMSKRGMTDVMHQRQRLSQIDVELERGGDRARDLRHLHGVGQPGTKVVGVAAGEDLRLVLEPAKGAGVDDAVAVALKGVAVRVRRLEVAASAGVLDANRVAGEHGESLPASQEKQESNRGFTRMKLTSHT